MSYSSETKEELCRYEPDSVCCLLAELSGIISVAGSVFLRGGGEKRLSIETENSAVAQRTYRLLREVFDASPELATLHRARLGGRNAHRIMITGDEASFVLEGCGIEVVQRRVVPRDVTVRKCCRMSFLRGVFLACGSVTAGVTVGSEVASVRLARLVAAVMARTTARANRMTTAER